MENFEWVSEDVEKFYNIVNLVYRKAILFRHPYVKKVEITKESFNDIFKTDKWLNNLDVIICADFILMYDLRRNSDNKNENESLGSEVNKLLRNTINIVPGNEIVGTKHISPNLLLNEKKYCENIISRTY
jgi:hypothetical protein